ncbi:hypothetical protein CPB84DRAFT_845175 [Gymnopilus junonius]|uniref:C2H2-type domain-containing protein n=1 Tax=Gymnopilus junonius TaxID=109634 RepID=A0A9P5NQ19_GYMJU|nr:hypothetical protein CPB84DRAFT_845175 [Gymnopilus junonius]
MTLFLRWGSLKLYPTTTILTPLREFGELMFQNEYHGAYLDNSEVEYNIGIDYEEPSADPGLASDSSSSLQVDEPPQSLDQWQPTVAPTIIYDSESEVRKSKKRKIEASQQDTVVIERPRKRQNRNQDKGFNTPRLQTLRPRRPKQPAASTAQVDGVPVVEKQNKVTDFDVSSEALLKVKRGPGSRASVAQAKGTRPLRTNLSSDSEYQVSLPRSGLSKKSAQKQTSGVERYRCPSCPKDYSRRADAMRHDKSVHKNEGHRCTVCHKSFNRKDSLKRHLQGSHKQHVSTPLPRMRKRQKKNAGTEY